MKPVFINIPSNRSMKTVSLVQYICYKLKDEKTFGSTVLNKTLYYIDNIWYKKTKDTISGFKYIKQSNGPTPMPNQFLQIREYLIKSGLLEIEQVERYGFTRKVPKAAKKPDMKIFNSDELVFINDIIDIFKDVNASIASSLTHELPAWNIAYSMEELPFSTFLLSEADLTERDIELAKKAIKAFEKHGKAA